MQRLGPEGVGSDGGLPAGAEGTAERLWRRVAVLAEVVPQHRSRAETGPFGDQLDRLVGLLQQPLGEQQPLRGEP